MTKLNIKDIDVKHITPDPNQPRKYFNAEKMKTLTNSIKQYGIKQPLIVQEVGKDKCLISVGERRYRAAVALGLKDVPCLVEKAQTEIERLVEQFNVEEQHEAWTPVEKAVAINTLGNQMGLEIAAVCKLLNIDEQSQRRYVAFAGVVDKGAWVKNEVPLDYAQGISGLKSVVRKISEEALEKEFTRADEMKFEHRIITLVKSGVMQRRTDLGRLKDSFRKDPKSISTFMTNAKATPLSLYISTKAKGSHHLRNAYMNAGYVTMHGEGYLALRDVKIMPEHLVKFRRAVKVLEQLIEIGEK